MKLRYIILLFSVGGFLFIWGILSQPNVNRAPPCVSVSFTENIGSLFSTFKLMFGLILILLGFYNILNIEKKDSRKG